jgi:hypothetical protein
MRRSLSPMLGIVLALGIGSRALADDARAGEAAEEAAPTAAMPEIVDAPGIDYPAAQSLGVGDSLYIDQTYESSSDLSTLSWVTGHGTNYRLAVGGTLHFGELRLVGEIPVQYTHLHIDTLQGVPTIDRDRDKTAPALGDAVLGAAYLWTLPVEAIDLRIGLGLRTRWPTHTTQFTFMLASGTPYTFGFPYYFHFAPALLVVASASFLTFSMNQGVLGMLVQDVTVDGIRQSIPNLLFWESHYAVAAQPLDWLGLGLELVSCMQLNQVDDAGYTTLHGVRAVALNPSATLTLWGLRASFAGRFGLTQGTRDLGVITFSGERALLARVSYLF